MAKQIDPIKKERYKRARLKGNKSIKQSLIEAGYSLNSAVHSSGLGVVKCIEAEIKEEFKISDVTVENVLKNLEHIKQLAIQKQDYATAKECEIWKGKHLAMFTDKQEIRTITSERQSLLNTLAQSLLLNKENIINTPQDIVGNTNNN